MSLDHLGFVPLDELMNRRAEFQRQVREDLYPQQGVPPSRQHVEDFVDAIFLTLQRHAKFNLQNYLRTHPNSQLEAIKAGMSPDLTRAQYEARKQQSRILNNKS